MEHYFARRKVDGGLQQGSPEGTQFDVTAIHFCVGAESMDWDA